MSAPSSSSKNSRKRAMRIAAAAAAAMNAAAMDVDGGDGDDGGGAPLMSADDERRIFGTASVAVAPAETLLVGPEGGPRGSASAVAAAAAAAGRDGAMDPTTHSYTPAQQRRLVSALRDGSAAEAAHSELDETIRRWRPPSVRDAEEVEAAALARYQRSQQERQEDEQRMRRDLAARGIQYRPVPRDIYSGGGGGNDDDDASVTTASAPTLVTLPDPEAAERAVAQHVAALSAEGFPDALLYDPMAMLVVDNELYEYTRDHRTVESLDDVMRPMLLVPPAERRRHRSIEFFVNTLLRAGAHPKQWRKMTHAENCVCLTFQMQQRREEMERLRDEQRRLDEQEARQARERVPVRAGMIDPSTVKLMNDEQRDTHLADHLGINVLLLVDRSGPTEDARAWAHESVRPELHCSHLAMFSTIEYNSPAARAVMRRDGRLDPPREPWLWSLVCYFYSYF